MTESIAVSIQEQKESSPSNFVDNFDLKQHLTNQKFTEYAKIAEAFDKQLLTLPDILECNENELKEQLAIYQVSPVQRNRFVNAIKLLPQSKMNAKPHGHDLLTSIDLNPESDVEIKYNDDHINTNKQNNNNNVNTNVDCKTTDEPIIIVMDDQEFDNNKTQNDVNNGSNINNAGRTEHKDKAVAGKSMGSGIIALKSKDRVPITGQELHGNCDMAYKQFNICTNDGTEILHSIYCVASRTYDTINGKYQSKMYIQLRDDGEIIKMHQNGEKYDLGEIVGHFGQPGGIYPLTLNDINEKITIGFYGYGIFLNQSNRFRMYINDIDVETGGHINNRFREYLDKPVCYDYFAMFTLVFWFFIAPYLGGTLLSYIFLGEYWPGTHWLAMLVALFLTGTCLCCPGVWASIQCCQRNVNVVSGFSLTGIKHNGPAIIEMDVSQEQLDALKAHINKVEKVANTMGKVGRKGFDVGKDGAA